MSPSIHLPSHCGRDRSAQGVRQVKKTDLNPVYLFISPPSMSDLRNRLRGRGTESEESVAKRLAMAQKEIEYATPVAPLPVVLFPTPCVSTELPYHPSALRLSLRHAPFRAAARARRAQPRAGRGDYVRHGRGHRREYTEHDQQHGHEGGSREGARGLSPYLRRSID